MNTFSRILIANRGEIAVRIARTCREMGIATVAVYSDFDREALHVRVADMAVPIGGTSSSAGEGICAPRSGKISSARETYLNIEKIIAAARRTGADAIHPGYGFLAEDADFAAACEAAGIAFIGPRAEVIRALGSKTEGRKLAQAAGVPVVPEPREDEFPKLIKAAAGGGGRGMRIVRHAAEYQDALRAAAGEAERAFGDGTLLVEKYVEGARHIEIQIFGDHHGNVLHLYERDCSVQRRYQKIIEESPSPAVTPELRQRMGEAALALARRIGYTNAGTVEFLLAPSPRQEPGSAASGEFYFIEVNTRIQVEHPITEMVTGLDLVRWQIEIAQGGALPAEAPRQSGHAIEARLYAEDPANNFLPSTGTLHVWELPAFLSSYSSSQAGASFDKLRTGSALQYPTHQQAGASFDKLRTGPALQHRMDAGLRIESGVEQGSEIGVYYDPLLAKVIAHAPDRDSAIRKLAHALKQFAAQGVATNREFLIEMLESDAFRAGRAHTGFRLAASAAHGEERDRLYAAIAQAYKLHNEHRRRKILPGIPPGFRNNPYPAPAARFAVEGRELQVSAAHPGLELLRVDEESVAALVDGVRHQFAVCRAGETYYIRSGLGQRAVVELPRYPRAAGAARQAANSPMPGQVLRVLVDPGQRVAPGDPLVVLEAMKMEQTVRATMSGMVDAVLVRPGEIVSPGQMLVEIHSVEDSDEHASSSAAKR